jgi:hypothetical protein
VRRELIAVSDDRIVVASYPDAVKGCHDKRELVLCCRS